MNRIIAIEHQPAEFSRELTQVLTRGGVTPDTIRAAAELYGVIAVAAYKMHASGNDPQRRPATTFVNDTFFQALDHLG